MAVADLAKSCEAYSRSLMAEDKQPHRSRFHKAKDDAQFARQATTTPQTAHPAYRLAFQDNDFLLREDADAIIEWAPTQWLWQVEPPAETP